ncbi:hypothetical protein JVX96_24445 [Variovorax sp. PDNC026]|uniref:hypothetical protein n=1 Tax=Variovorax sp. PDNC026 TaxID=2811425 RepID=UPI001963504D|nr:hypothetical protein [Variovorax sp. PDNC026]QRY31194.1 hypothetical protein JVX96_24445 [Variovorax sp. PDNC026]
MTNAITNTRVAVSAQRILHEIAVSERHLQQSGLLTSHVKDGIAVARAVARRTLNDCATHFATLAPANDGAFNPTPEPELA